jgi:hypothetical protein
MDIGAELAGLGFIVFGVWMILHPTEFTMTPDSTNAQMKAGLGPDQPVHVSKTGAELYGILSIAVGTGFSFMALYPERD